MSCIYISFIYLIFILLFFFNFVCAKVGRYTLICHFFFLFFVCFFLSLSNSFFAYVTLSVFSCSISVRNNQKNIYCDNCLNWTHLKCTKLSNNDFISLTNNNEHWFYSTCLSNIFPFNGLVDYFDFLTCFYNFSHCNKPNPNLIKNFHQL